MGQPFWGLFAHPCCTRVIPGAPFRFPQEPFWYLQWPHLLCQALRCKPCTPLVPWPQGPLHRPLSQTQLHPSTCLPGGPLSCRLNISLMAISCLNMSWAKPLCEYPENKWLPAGTTAMPPLQSISYGCLICFPSLLCLQSAHLLSRSDGFTPSWTKGNGLCYMAEENPQSCFPFPPCSISPGYPKARPSLQSHVCSPSQPTPQCLGSANA